MTIETIRFANDTQTRKRLMVPESFQHPAKGQLGMWATMIERYSQPGDTVLDPMSGSGATLLAALMGRNVICVELEQHFVEPMRRSWAKMRTMPMLGHEMGQATILQGDARSLSELLGLENPVLEQSPDLGVDVVISSPPYEGSITGDTAEATRKRIAEGKYHGLRPDVFTSPGNVAGSSYGDGYTRPVDAIVTSPPFSDARHDDVDRANRATDGRLPHVGDATKAWEYGVTGNIGNLRNASYWEAMRQVYAECWRVLKPGGILALVLKGFTRDGQYVDLPAQTEALLLEAGWQKHDEWRRELWSLSFWRILQKRRDPAAWDDRLMYEEVLAFKKPGGYGNGVDAVLTSPPYEGSLVLEQNGIDADKLKQPHGPNSQFARPQRYTRKERP